MAKVEIRDHAIWIKHIFDGNELKDRLTNLEPGSTIKLAVDDVPGLWVKMSNGSDGRPTPGIKAADKAARDHWHGLQGEHRGEVVDIWPLG